jgi:hypothetical protein
MARWLILCVLLGAAASAAADVTTPPFFVEAGESVECAIVNLGRKEITFEPQVRTAQGVVESAGTIALSTQALRTISYAASSGNHYWCHFVGRVKAKQVRASAQVRDSGNAVRLIIPAN